MTSVETTVCVAGELKGSIQVKTVNLERQYTPVCVSSMVLNNATVRSAPTLETQREWMNFYLELGNSLKNGNLMSISNYESQAVETYIVDDIGNGLGLRCKSYIIEISADEPTLDDDNHAQVNSSVLVAS